MLWLSILFRNSKALEPNAKLHRISTPSIPMPNEPLSSGDDSLILQLLDIVAQRLHQLLTQGMVLENQETINQTQLKIDRLRQQLDRLRIVLRRQKEAEQRKRKLGKQAA